MKGRLKGAVNGEPVSLRCALIVTAVEAAAAAAASAR